MFSSPATLHFEVTSLCNNFCPHCYGSSWIRTRRKTAPPVADIAKRIAGNNIFDVVVTGGEPLMAGLETLSDVFRIFNESNIQYSLNTNGRLLTPETCAALARAGLKGVLVSLHSWDDALHDAMVNARNAAVETKAGLKNAIAAGLHVTVNQVIGPHNIRTMLETAVALEKMGVHGVSFSRLLSPLDVKYAVGMVDAKQFIDEYIKCRNTLAIPVKSLIPIPFCADPRVKDLHEQLNCTGGISTAAISCYGDLRFCPQDTRVWGNVLQEDLSAIWSRIVEWREAIAVPERCKDCAFLPDCRGGCRVAAKICFDDYAACDPWFGNMQQQWLRKVRYHPFKPDTTYLLVPNIRWRKEDDAVLIYCRDKFLLVNGDGLRFVEQLPRRFVPAELDLGTDANRQANLEFLELLYQKGLLVSPGGGKDA